VEQTLDNQINYWIEGFSLDEQEDSRYGYVEEDSVGDKHLIQDVLKILNNLADKAHLLIGNYTSNLSENWMSVRMKFDGGKVINRCQKGSWHDNCYGASLRRNMGVEWSPLTWELATWISASTPFRKHFHERKRIHDTRLKSPASDGVKRRALQRKMQLR
jgi:hypothetical protein